MPRDDGSRGSRGFRGKYVLFTGTTMPRCPRNACKCLVRRNWSTHSADSAARFLARATSCLRLIGFGDIELVVGARSVTERGVSPHSLIAPSESRPCIAGSRSISQLQVPLWKRTKVCGSIAHRSYLTFILWRTATLQSWRYFLGKNWVT